MLDCLPCYMKYISYAFGCVLSNIKDYLRVMLANIRLVRVLNK